MKPVSPGGRVQGATAGFSLPEAIAYLILFALMMSALTYATAALFKTQAEPEVSYNGNNYPQAPSFDAFSRAVRLHAAFSQSVDQADNIIILGGTRSHPTLDPIGPSSVLSESFANTTLSDAVGSDPFMAFSSWDQRTVNAVQFSSYLTTSSDPADFTILTVQGLSEITSITQQRRVTETINGQSDVLYDVTYQAIDWTTTPPTLTPNSYTGTTPTYSYRVFYAANEDSWAQPPGVTHYWYRADSTWDRDQEAPALVVFADPYALAGQDTTAQITSVSRFLYFLPACR